MSHPPPLPFTHTPSLPAQFQPHTDLTLTFSQKVHIQTVSLLLPPHRPPAKISLKGIGYIRIPKPDVARKTHEVKKITVNKAVSELVVRVEETWEGQGGAIEGCSVNGWMCGTSSAYNLLQEKRG